MYPSNSNGNYSDHSIFVNHGHNFPTDSKQEEDQDPSLSFFNFPSPYYNQCEFDDVFLHHNQTFLMPDSVSNPIINNNPAGSSKNEEDSKKATEVVQQQPLGKRSSSSKKDRHSKINTRNGLRDRRMRLSLDVAREFFGLQDMLGFDKASRTVEWLLIHAREEIRKLRSRVSNTNNITSKSPSNSTSEGEVVSALEGTITITMGKPTTTTMVVEKKVRQQNPLLARDLREKARARAKARTKAKKKLCTGRETHEHNTSLLQAETKELSSRDIEHMIDEPVAIVNKWNSNPMFNCLQNSGINQEHQLTGFLSFGKPWEAYN